MESTNATQIPRKIWALWLDFNNKTDGLLDENLTFFKNTHILLLLK